MASANREIKLAKQVRAAEGQMIRRMRELLLRFNLCLPGGLTLADETESCVRKMALSTLIGLTESKLESTMDRIKMLINDVRFAHQDAYNTLYVVLQTPMCLIGGGLLSMHLAIVLAPNPRYISTVHAAFLQVNHQGMFVNKLLGMHLAKVDLPNIGETDIIQKVLEGQVPVLQRQECEDGKYLLKFGSGCGVCFFSASCESRRNIDESDDDVVALYVVEFVPVEPGCVWGMLGTLDGPGVMEAHELCWYMTIEQEIRQVDDIAEVKDAFAWFFGMHGETHSLEEWYRSKNAAWVMGCWWKTALKYLIQNEGVFLSLPSAPTSLLEAICYFLCAPIVKNDLYSITGKRFFVARVGGENSESVVYSEDFEVTRFISVECMAAYCSSIKPICANVLHKKGLLGVECDPESTHKHLEALETMFRNSEHDDENGDEEVDDNDGDEVESSDIDVSKFIETQRATLVKIARGIA
ncbi:MAG: hypothetical protein CL854_07295 [Cryomorphaceae bacterium]|nr:hypothetical protein [Cryomorphaceae bacterium]